MTHTTYRPLAIVLSAFVAIALWLPTITVPADQARLAATTASIELA